MTLNGFELTLQILGIIVLGWDRLLQWRSNHAAAKVPNDVYARRFLFGLEKEDEGEVFVPYPEEEIAKAAAERVSPEKTLPRVCVGFGLILTALALRMIF
jgi:hypothetical protein